MVRQEQAQSAALARVVEEVRSAVQQAAVVNIDETGWKQEKQRAWLWTVVTAQLTVFRIDRSRGGVAVEALLGAEFGGVVPLDRMSVTFERGTCGLIGPNGAGKTTFFNVLSGFVKPAGGSVRAFDEDLLAMTHYRRARWGVRRTFQTEQAIEELSVYDNVAMIHEHSKMTGGSRREDVLGAIEFVKLDIDPYAKVGSLGAAQRRLEQFLALRA